MSAMEILRWLRRYWRDWRGNARLDEEIADELRFHLDMMAEEEARSGTPPDEARAMARRRFGRVDSLQAACRDARGIGSVDMLKQDVSFGWRLLRRSPAFTTTAVVTLILGIGTGTAGFSLVYAVLLKPLPYHAAGRLVVVSQTDRDGTPGSVAAANWQDWARSARTLEGLAAFSRWNFTLAGEPEAIRVDGAIVLGPFFGVLGVPAAVGRTFGPAAPDSADTQVVVISDGLWRRRFGADPAIVGRSIRMAGSSVRIVGVMPPLFAYPFPTTDVWAPLAMSPAIVGDRGSEWLKTIGRLAPGASVADARAELVTLARQLADAYPDVNRDESAAVVSLHEQVVGDVQPTLVVLMVAAAFLFLVACVNLAALQLSRSGARSREIAMRTALGATRLRMLRQILTESLLLAVAGAAGGALLAAMLVRLAVAAAPEGLPRLQEIGFDWRALLVAVAAGGVASVVFATAPIARLLRTDLREHLSEGAHGQTAGGGTVARQTLLVGAQVAIAVALLVGAGLLQRSFHALSAVDPGFDPDVMSVRVFLPRAQYATDERQAAFFHSVVDRILALRGVTAAGAVSDLPLVGNDVSFPFTVRGIEPASPADRPLTGFRAVTPGYFAAMRIALRAGRGVDAADNAGAAPVAVVNRTMAERHLDGNAIGRQLQVSGDPRWLTVVGVVDDVRQLDVAEDEGPAIYVPLAQKRRAFLTWMTLVARGERGDLAAAMRRAVREVDRDQPAFDAMTMRERFAEAIATPRLAAGVLLALAAASALLAVVGVYGTMAFSVARRTREIGVRVALGATRADIVRLILHRALLIVGAGLLAGLPAALVLARWMVTMLFGVSPYDVGTYFGAAAVFAAAALLAAAVPARRAACIDPLLTMKAD